MKFDVIIGNPPYQLSDGGAGASAKPLYNLFIANAKKMNPKYISMIIPSRWFAGGKGLDEFRVEMLNDDRFKEIYDFPNPKECFPSNNISGGVMYFLWQNNYHGNCKFTNIINGEKIVSMRKLNEFDIFIRYNNAISIIHKVIEKKENKLVDIITSRKPFGLDSFERGHSEYVSGDVKLVTSSGNGYYRKKDILVGRELIEVYKVIIGKALSGHIGETDENGQVKVLARVEILPPQYVCTESYLCIGKYKDEKTALNLEKYLKTKFVRFLLLQALTSMNITKDKFQFVPIQDFSKSWTDEELYKKYSLSNEEISFIESMIKPME